MLADPIVCGKVRGTDRRAVGPEDVKLDVTRLFPGMDGIPFRNAPGQPVPMIKHDDPEYMQPKTTADAHAKVFNLAKAPDLKEYNDVWDKAAKGHVLISKEELHWSDKEQSFLAFLRWGELYLELSREGANAHRSTSG